MPITLKNEEVEQLAREVARLGDTTLTDAIGTALKDWLAQNRGRRRVPALKESLLEISVRCSSLPDLDSRSAEDILAYDERGTTGHGG